MVAWCCSKPCAARAAMIPVSVSPEPAVPSAGVPFRMMVVRCSGDATNVRVPFRRTVAVVMSRSCSTASTRSRSRLSTPYAPAASPGCGVKIVCRPAAVRALRSSGDAAYSASASMTTGPANISKTNVTMAAVSLVRPRPGPMAMQSVREMRAMISCCVDENESVPAGSAGQDT